MSTHVAKIGELFFLLHPGDVQFSGYGLTVEQGSVKRLMGMLMVDRPQPVSQSWLAEIERRYGDYHLYAMTQTGERGIACQMFIDRASLPHVRQLPGVSTGQLQAALFPLLFLPPAPQLDVTWSPETRLWQSSFHETAVHEQVPLPPFEVQLPRFSLGTVVATPGALAALEEAGQVPHEFLHRHLAGEWGDLDPEDKKANERAVRAGERILSAYLTNKGTRIWLITERDRSSTTILLPQDY